jgi:predicted PhzF superfamily epimerase YddE/YHI9
MRSAAAARHDAHHMRPQIHPCRILSWFTPTTEVPLCGHGTLASAAALFYGAGNPAPELRFLTASGPLVVRRAAGGPSAAAAAAGGAGELLEMSLPSAPPDGPLPDEAAMVAALRCGVDAVAWTGLASGLGYGVVRLRDGTSRAQLEALTPDSAALMAAGGGAVRGLIVTCAGEAASSSGGGGGFDFLSRFFGPWIGIPEDPVTGSAHSVLCPYWAAELGRPRLSARQCSARGGDLAVTLEEGGGRVLVAGPATVVVAGSLRLR